jgi:hypothetical protein
MRYLAIHDRHGAIASLIAGPDDGPPLTVALRPGHEVTEVDLADAGIDLTTFESERDATEAIESFRVDVRREGRLVRRRRGEQAD